MLTMYYHEGESAKVKAKKLREDITDDVHTIDILDESNVEITLFGSLEFLKKIHEALENHIQEQELSKLGLDRDSLSKIGDGWD